MSEPRGKRHRQRTSLFVLATLSPFLFGECSLLLNDLPEPADEAPNSSQGGGGSAGAPGTSRGGSSSNQGGSAGSGEAGSGTEAAGSGGTVLPAGGVGGGATEAGGEAGRIATGGAAGAAPSEGGAAGNGCPCDCDKDGALNDDPGCHAGGGPADCDDEDPDVRPGQTDWFTAANDVVTFDYDCENGTEREFEATLSCPPLLADCDPNEGYIGTLPQCGASGDWGQCQPNGLGGCQAVVETNMRKMGCH